jgi:hypothetical protein
VTAHRAALLVVVAFILFAARLFWLIWRYAVNIFFSDQWDFNDATLFQQHSLWQMFTWQHGWHRQGLGALFEKLVDPPFHWNSRIESFIVGGVIVAAAICALQLKRRLYGGFSVSDVVIPAILFTPEQWETLFGTANFAHGPLPLLLIVLYCLAWTCERKAVKYPVVLLLNFLTIYTGFGFFLGVLTPILLVLEYWASTPEARLPRPYLVCFVIVSLLSLGAFFLGHAAFAGSDCFSFQPRSPTRYLSFITLMLANFFTVRGTGAFPRIAGATVLAAILASLAVAVWRLARRRSLGLPEPEQKRNLITTVLIAYSVLFCAGTAYGRLCGGLQTAQSPRYPIYLEPAMLGLYFHLLSVG